MKIHILEFGELISSVATPEGWRLSHSQRADLSEQESWPTRFSSEAIQTQQILDFGLAEVGEGDILIPWNSFGNALDMGFSILAGVEISPLILELDAQDDLGYSDFKYRYSFRLGASSVAVERIGYFIRQISNERIFLLDRDTFLLLEEMDHFNARPDSHRASGSWNSESWDSFARVKDLAALVGAKIIDPSLRDAKVVVTSALNLKIVTHDDSSISYAPQLLSNDGQSALLGQGDADKLERRFLQGPFAKSRYTLDQANEDKLHILFPEKQKKALERMKLVRRLTGVEKEFAQNNPAAFFEGLGDVVYWGRVNGIGDISNAIAPPANGVSGGFLTGSTDFEANRGACEPYFHELGVEVTSLDNGVVNLKFRSLEELGEARATISLALDKGQKECVLQGHILPITPELREAFNAEPASEKIQGERVAKGGLYLLTHANQESLWEDPLKNNPGTNPAAELYESMRNSWLAPKSLRVDLLPHQIEALRWLHLCASLQPGRRGALLADDMGLGKTLQVLTYMAGLIERGAIREGSPRSPDIGPWRPVLIVAPLILVENDTWQAEMIKCFANGGEVFKPVLVLHGAGVERVKIDAAGRETKIGRPTLDCEKLMQYRVVITSYETAVNYQHSLAQLKEGKPIWSLIVTDEAQKYKSPQTKTSHALKAIDSPFNIACTGTPVENRLLDVWNILDTIQPSYLGDANSFNKSYEIPIVEGNRDEALGRLKSVLKYQEPHAFLMRREKGNLKPGSLPEKKVQRLFCEMSTKEVDAHLSILSGISSGRKGVHLQALHRLVQLYQHPILLRSNDHHDGVQELLGESGKLRAVISTLRDIRTKGEKAILFARHIKVQNLLSEVIQAQLGVHAPIINGVTSENLSSSSAGTLRTRDRRKKTLDEFRSAPGFGIIILSPFVAGIGLTITEANHVIHYGRWWNPAVESQATDRAYRIGAKLPVTVYLPILRDPSGRIERSFDELLDDLLERKSALAREFLMPVSTEDELGQELYSSLFGKSSVRNQQKASSSLRISDVDNLTPVDFEALVAALYTTLGYNVVLTPLVGDGGADVIATIGGRSTLIQAKHSRFGNPVDISGLDDVLAAHSVYGAALPSFHFSCVVVTNSLFTEEAQMRAKESGVELISRIDLTEKLLLNELYMGDLLEVAATRARNFAEGIELFKARVISDRK